MRAIEFDSLLMTLSERSDIRENSYDLGWDKSIKHGIEVALALAFMPMLCAAADIPCPAPEPAQQAAETAPEEIYSVDFNETDGEIDYSIFVDLEYGSYSLDGVVLAYVANDEILLLSSVKPVRLESQAVISIVVDRSISEDIRVYWVYREPGAMCPETVSFEHRISESLRN